MKIDSEWLDVNVNPEFQTMEAKTKSTGKQLEFWDDGDICFCLDDQHYILIRVEELEEIVRVYKIYRDRRIVYLSNRTE